MPFAGFKDFDECVRKMKNRKGVTNAKGLCADMERKAKESKHTIGAIIEEINEFVGLVTTDGGDVIEKVEKSLLNYRDGIFPNSQCMECKFFDQGACSVVAGDISQTDTCDAFQPEQLDNGYNITDWEKFIKGLMTTAPLQIKVLGAVLTPVGRLIILEDNMGVDGHRYSMYEGDFIKLTASWHGWTSNEVQNMEVSGGSLPDPRESDSTPVDIDQSIDNLESKLIELRQERKVQMMEDRLSTVESRVRQPVTIRKRIKKDSDGIPEEVEEQISYGD